MNKTDLGLKILDIINAQLDECIDENLQEQAFILNVIYTKIAKLIIEEHFHEDDK